MLTYEYIRGLIDGEGSFTFCSAGSRDTQKERRVMLPTFAIHMSERDTALLLKVRDSLELRNRIYTYPPRKSKDGYKRMGMACLMVRDFGQIKNIIVPLCYKKLNGYKAKQFEEWIKRISIDERVPKLFKLIPVLYRSGFYEKSKFILNVKNVS